MKIVEKYSHLNGLEFLLVHKPMLWREIQEVINVLTPLYEGWLGLSAKEQVHFSNPRPELRSIGGSSLSTV